MAVIIVLLLAGALLLILETIIPGGLAGTAGAIALAAGIVMSFTQYGTATGIIVLLLTLVGLVMLFGLYIAYFPQSKVGRKFSVEGSIGSIKAERPELIGKTGVAITPLRPSGMARIDGKKVDVITRGEFIEPGTPIRVIEVEGPRVVVRAELQ